MNPLVVDNIEFTFSNSVVDAFKFDDNNRESPHFHGIQQFNAVDLLIETQTDYFFVEIKSYNKDYSANFASKHKCSNCGKITDKARFLKDYLIRKYRDSFLYRYCEDKVDKPIQYIVLIVSGFDGLVNSQLKKQLKEMLPVGNKNPDRWNHYIAKSVYVLDIDTWKRTMSDKLGTIRSVLNADGKIKK